MKYFFTFIICLGFISMSSSIGQAETKKVVIVKKVVDKNGNTTTEREEASGKEADALLKKMEEEGALDGIDIDVEIEKAKTQGSSSKTKLEDVTIKKSMVNGKELTTYKITTEENGEKRVMIWKSDDGEIPEEMSEMLENIDIKTETANDGKEMRISINAEDHDGANGVHETHTVEKRIVVEHKTSNKVSLGIMIEDDSEGVVISDIVAESLAQKAGLKKGDTIIKVYDNYVFNTKMLLKALSGFDKGDDVKVTFLRDGKEYEAVGRF